MENINNVDILEQEYLNRAPYVDPDLVLILLDFFIEDLSNIVAEYISPALEPSVAKSISIKNVKEVSWFISIAICFIAGLCCTAPKKVIDQGIKISTEAEQMKNEILRWLSNIKEDEIANELTNLINIFDEPLLYRFTNDGIMLLLPKNFIIGRMRTCLFSKDGYFLQTDENFHTISLIGDITKEQLDNVSNERHFRGTKYKVVDKPKSNNKLLIYNFFL